MNFEKILSLGVEKNIINENQKNDLINLYNQNDNEPKKLSGAVKTFYYLGGLIMLGAMITLMSNTVQNSTYTVILLLGTLYAVLFFVIGEYLWKRNEKLACGILYFLFVAAFSFIILDIEKMTGFFPHFSDMDKYSNYWAVCTLPVIVLSLLTIIVNTVLQKFRQVSILALPTIFSCYAIYLSIVHLLFGGGENEYTIIYALNILFGIILTITAFIQDRHSKVDYSSWSYFLGAAGMFFSALLLSGEIFSEDWSVQLVVFIMSVIYISFGLLIKRASFSVIGVLGFIEYIIYLEFAYINVENTMLLTCILLITGLIVLYTGVLYNKNADKIRAHIIKYFPEKIKAYLPDRD